MDRDTVIQIRQVTFTGFVIFAITYLLSILLQQNSIGVDFLQVVVNYIDLPLYFSGIILLTSKVILTFDLTDEGKGSTLIATWVFACSVFIGLTILDFFAIN